VIKRPGNELFRFCQEKTLKFRAELDYDRINGPLIIRSRKSGDKYQPIGQSGRKSLKNILIDNKIPTIYRDKMPIVEENSDICWLVGYRIGANFSVKNKTKRVLNLTVEIK